MAVALSMASIHSDEELFLTTPHALPARSKVRLQTSCSYGLPHDPPVDGLARVKPEPINGGHMVCIKPPGQKF